jgi:hypothetical protein
MRKRSKDLLHLASWRTSSRWLTILIPVNQEKIKDIEIVRTVTGGSTVYEK